MSGKIFLQTIVYVQQDLDFELLQTRTTEHRTRRSKDGDEFASGSNVGVEYMYCLQKKSELYGYLLLLCGSYTNQFKLRFVPDEPRGSPLPIISPLSLSKELVRSGLHMGVGVGARA